MRIRAAHWSLMAVLLSAVAGAGAWWFAPRTGPDQQFQLALMAVERGDLEQAAGIAESLDETPGFADHARLIDGAVLLRRDEPLWALRQFDQLSLDGEVGRHVLGWSIECLYRLGRLAEAEAAARRLAGAAPDDPLAHRWLGVVYYDLGAYDAAIAAMNRVIELVPGDYVPHRLIGMMTHEFGLEHQAIPHFRKALALAPPPEVRDEIRAELGESLVADREYAAAIDVLDDAPRTPRVAAIVAESLWSLGEHEQARQLLRQQSEAGEFDRRLALLEARIASEEGRAREAVAPLQHALRQNPHDTECRYQLAIVWRQLGESEQYETDLARWKESSALHQRLTELNVLAIGHPHDAAVRDELALICRKLGRDQLAGMWQRAADACRAAMRRGSAEVGTPATPPSRFPSSG